MRGGDGRGCGRVAGRQQPMAHVYVCVRLMAWLVRQPHSSSQHFRGGGTGIPSVGMGSSSTHIGVRLS